MDFSIEAGEKRETKTSSVRTYFYYVTQSGYDCPLHNAPAKRVASRTHATTAKRMTETIYSTYDVFRIKMFTSMSAFGRPMQRKSILIQVDPSAEVISLRGYNDTGGFHGRGRLLTPLSKEEVKAFSIKILEPAEPLPGQAVRKVVFRKEKK